MQIKLSNDFHRTSANVRVIPDERGSLMLSASQVRRARKILCGIKGCTCGGHAGERMADARVDVFVHPSDWDRTAGPVAEIITA